MVDFIHMAASNSTYVDAGADFESDSRLIRAPLLKVSFMSSRVRLKIIAISNQLIRYRTSSIEHQASQSSSKERKKEERKKENSNPKS